MPPRWAEPGQQRVPKRAGKIWEEIPVPGRKAAVSSAPGWKNRERSQGPAARWGWGEAGDSPGTGGSAELAFGSSIGCPGEQLWALETPSALTGSGASMGSSPRLLRRGREQDGTTHPLDLQAPAPSEPEPALPLLPPPWSCQGRQNPSSQSHHGVPRRCLQCEELLKGSGQGWEQKLLRLG